MAKKKTDTTSIGFEDTIWQAADKLRGNLDAAEYKNVVLGLIFLKFISDRFEGGKVYDVVELMPQFPGGMGALMQYLSSHIKYPVVTEAKGMMGFGWELSLQANTSCSASYRRTA